MFLQRPLSAYTVCNRDVQTVTVIINARLWLSPGLLSGLFLAYSPCLDHLNVVMIIMIICI